MRRWTLLGVSIVLVSLAACSSNEGTGANIPTGGTLDRFLEEGSRLELEGAIGDRLTTLIADGQLPYVVAEEASFDDATAEDTSGTGLPTGTWLAIAFEFPVSPDAGHPDGIELSVYGPLELYAEAVRPFIDQMDFVALYFLGWQDSGGSAFLIYPEHFRLYLDGDISVKQLSKKISIYGP